MVKNKQKAYKHIYTFALQEQEGCTLLTEEEQLEAAIFWNKFARAVDMPSAGSSRPFAGPSAAASMPTK